MTFRKTLLSICLFLQISMFVLAQERNLESIGIITTEIINSEVYHPGYPDYRKS